MNRHCADDTFAGFDLPPEVRYGGRVFEGAGVIMPPATVADNIKRGTDAMKRVIASKSDEPMAMFRKELGWIAFYYGKVGSPPPECSGGSGIAKIIAKRDWEGIHIKELRGQKGVDVALKLVEVLAKATIKPTANNRIEVRFGNYLVVLSKTRFRQQEIWLLNGYKEVHPYTQLSPDELGAVPDTSKSTPPEPTRSASQEGSGVDLTLPLPPSNVKPVFESAYDWRAAIDEATTLNEIKSVWGRLFPKPVNPSFYNGIDAPIWRVN